MPARILCAMKLILAPMAALSHSGLRRLIAIFGEPDEYFSEMIHAPSAVSGGGFEKWYFRTAPSPEKLVWQITSPAAEPAAKAVPVLLKHGGIGIDLNMGCAAPQIVSTGAGFAWMKKPLTETAELVRLVKKAVLEYEKTKEAPRLQPIRLSVKLRLGETDDYAFLLRFCKMLTNEGVELITLHPRTRKQSYSRSCRHEYTARLAADLPVPVYGSGDIGSAEAALGFNTKYKCAGWMIGRAAVQKPWIFYAVRAAENAAQPFTSDLPHIDLLKTAADFLHFLKEEQPPEFHLTRAKRFFNFYCDNCTFAHHIKTKILNCPSCDAMYARLEEYFGEVPQDRFTATLA